MKKRHLLLLLNLLLLSAVVVAQRTDSFTVTGEVTTPLEWTRKDLAALPIVTHTVRDRDNKDHTFRGVALGDVLQKAGVPLGPALRGQHLTRYLLVQAADGYEVVYALPEVDPEFSSQGVILAYEKDGQPLAAGEGPFRLIAPGDKKQARWVREVRAIKVQFAK